MFATRVLHTLLAGIALGFCAQPTRGEDRVRPAAYVPFEGERSTWHDGFSRYDYVMDGDTLAIRPFQRPANEGFGIGAPPSGGRRCVVICPQQPAPGNPWSWRGCYWDHQPQTEIALLKRGFHVVYLSADASLKPDKYWDQWYAYLTEKHGLSPKPAFIGMSRGGAYALTWATTHPNQVTAIYADNTAADDESLRRLPELARAHVPLMLVCGTIDPILSLFTMTIESTYHQYGGRVSVMLKDGAGHHPHSLNDPQPLADFIEQSFQEKPAATPDFAAGKAFTRSSYYSLENRYDPFPQEGAYITRRGAAFTENYDRYEVPLGFAMPTTIIAPKSAAKGKPWVLRAAFVDRDARVDQALLANGFHIVVGPVGFNADGPDYADWNKLYQYLIEHGFSPKPVLEGAGGAASAVYGWAIANPGKVSCIYAENPVLDIPGGKTGPLENLAPLAAAKVALLHVCGSLDPALDTQTRVAEKRYQGLHGSITVLLKDGEGHFPTAPRDTKPVLNFILSHQGAPTRN
jgi:pimeloyl-ACP methyl ester carboxylesterase